MKKIILSLSVIAAVAAIAIGGTVAYFSDTETSQGNTLTAGTIDLAVNGQNPISTAVVTIPDVKPSQEIQDVLVKLQNVGTNDGIADLHIWYGTYAEGIDSEPECEKECGPGYWVDGRCQRHPGCMEENICTMIIYDYWYDLNGNMLKDKDDIYGLISPSQHIDLGLLPKGALRYLWLSHHLDGRADNEYQGDTCTWNIDFTLKQLGIPQ